MKFKFVSIALVQCVGLVFLPFLDRLMYVFL